MEKLIIGVAFVWTGIVLLVVGSILGPGIIEAIHETGHYDYANRAMALAYVLWFFLVGILLVGFGGLIATGWPRKESVIVKEPQSE